MNKEKKDITNIRIDYSKLKINFTESSNDPMLFFQQWFDDILKLDKHQATTCILSTISLSETPDSRVVLLKEINKDGFVFFTNYNSKKAEQIKKNSQVSLVFNWQDLERQIRISGRTQKIPISESDNYFSKRPRLSQIAAHISNQSKVISFETDFQNEIKELENKFKNQDIPRPSNWGGYLITPREVEFWQGRPSRLHDRLNYKKINQKWEKRRLSP